MNKGNKKKFKIILLIAGFAIFFVLIYKVGPSTIYHQLIVLKWKVLLLLLPFSLVFIFDTLGWKYAFTSSKISFKDLFLIRLAGESLNWIIPSANFAGEPMKAYFLKKHNVPMVEGMTSVVISKTILIISQIVFVMIGVAFSAFQIKCVRFSFDKFNSNRTIGDSHNNIYCFCPETRALCFLAEAITSVQDKDTLY